MTHVTPNFVFLPWILHNRYYHNIHWEMMRMIAMFHLHFLSTSSILEWLINNVKGFLLKLGMKSQIVLHFSEFFSFFSNWFDMNKRDNMISTVCPWDWSITSILKPWFYMALFQYLWRFAKIYNNLHHMSAELVLLLFLNNFRCATCKKGENM